MTTARRANRAALGALLAAVCCYGLAPVATRFLVVALAPPEILVVRFALTSLCFLPVILRVRPHRWPRPALLRALLCGFTAVGYYVPVTYGARWLPASITGLIAATVPLWIVALAAIVFGERPAASVVCGLVLAVAGVTALVLHTGFGAGGDGRTLAAGIALTLFGAGMWAAYSLAIRPLSRRYGSLPCTAVVMVIATAPLLPLTDDQLVPRVFALDWRGWGAVLLLTLGSTVAGTLLWNYGLAHVPPARAGLFLYLNPLVTVIGGSIVLGERLDAVTAVSGACIVGGVIVAQRVRYASPTGQ